VASPSLCVCLSRLTVDILSTFCVGLFVVQCVKLMLRIFEFELFVFIYWQNVTRLKRKRFTRYRHYVGEVEDIIIGILAVVSKLERLVAVYDAVLKSSSLCFFCGHPVYV